MFMNNASNIVQLDYHLSVCMLCFLDKKKQANDVNMLRLQLAHHVTSSRLGVARRQWLGRNGARTGE